MPQSWSPPTEKLEKRPYFHHMEEMKRTHRYGRAIHFQWLCHGMWLFHRHSAVKIQPFYPAFPLAGSMAKAFGWLFF